MDMWSCFSSHLTKKSFLWIHNKFSLLVWNDLISSYCINFKDELYYHTLKLPMHLHFMIIIKDRAVSLSWRPACGFVSWKDWLDSNESILLPQIIWWTRGEGVGEGFSKIILSFIKVRAGHATFLWLAFIDLFSYMFLLLNNTLKWLWSDKVCEVLMDHIIRSQFSMEVSSRMILI